MSYGQPAGWAIGGIAKGDFARYAAPFIVDHRCRDPSRRWPECTPVASSCSRTRAIRQRPQGQKDRHADLASRPPVRRRLWRHMSDSTSNDIDWVASSTGDPWSCSPRGRSMPSSDSPRAAGAARPQDRRVILNSAHGQAVVAVLLLHAGWAAEFIVRLSGRHQTRACAPSSRRPTSAPPSRERRAAPGRCGFTGATTTRCRR